MNKVIKRYSAVFLCVISSIFFMQTAIAEGDEHGENKLPVDKVKSDFAVMVLGSGGPVAANSGRAGSSLLIFTDGKPVLLVDTGSGSFKSLALSGAKLTDVHHFLYTHLHIDHTSDMSAMVKSLFFHRLGAGKLLPDSINFYGPGSDVPAYDPMSGYVAGHYDSVNGVERYLHGFAKAFFGGASPFVPKATDLPFNVASSEMTVLLNDHNGLTVKSIPVFHGGVPSVAYRIEYKGKSIVWSGDTNSRTDNMIRISNNANVLIYDTAILENPVPAFLLNLHTTPTRIGEVAAISQPHTLVLSHLSGATESNMEQIKHTIKAQGYRGKIMPANDLQVINVW